MTFDRYAIYWSPQQDSALAQFGQSWFGADRFAGALHGQTERFGLDADLVRDATMSPRRYGLHATIKAPFRLAPGRSEAELSAALADFCSRRRLCRSGPLRLHRFARYLALVPESDRAEIEWLADECVTHFDRFRAPLNEAERARRAGPHLSPLEQTYFEQFGYPQIFSRFFFHITLAGPLKANVLDEVERALAPAVEPFTKSLFCLEALCLSGDPGDGKPFQILERFPLVA